MQRHVAYVLALCLIAPCARVFAEAGSPMLTSDPGTPEKGHWEINTTFLYSESKHEAVVTAPLMDVNYGITDHLQLKVEAPWETAVTKKKGENRSGLGNSAIGLKYRFLDEDNDKLSMSFYPQVEFGSHAKSVSRDSNPNTTALILPFELEKKLGPIVLGMDFGVEFKNREKPHNFAGLAIGHSFTKRFELIGEVRQESTALFREMNLIANGGFRLKINKSLVLLGSAGTTFKRADPDAPRLFSYFAFQVKF